MAVFTFNAIVNGPCYHQRVYPSLFWCSVPVSQHDFQVLSSDMLSCIYFLLEEELYLLPIFVLQSTITTCCLYCTYHYKVLQDM